MPINLIIKKRKQRLFFGSEITLFELDLVIYFNRLKKTVLKRIGSV